MPGLVEWQYDVLWQVCVLYFIRFWEARARRSNSLLQ
jgi:hypothetical protein